MSCWSAQNFCHANGKDLASISDLNCVEEIVKEKSVIVIKQKRQIIIAIIYQVRLQH